jgi:glyoxylate/hydroxypyruvate reductase A
LALLFYSEDDDPVAWAAALRSRLPDLELRVWPEIGRPEEIDSALVWLPPPGMLAGLPNLRAIFSLGAGVDAMLRDPTLPGLPLCRMVDPSMTASMAEYVLTCVLAYHRRLDLYARQQAEARWRMFLPEPAAATRVGIMGLGEMGRAAAALLVAHGFTVRGWSRARHEIPGVTSFAGPTQLDDFLSGADVLVCLLPLTAETEDIIDARLLARLPEGARLIQVGRGGHLVEADLLMALDSGRLAHATLDVFREEPLPAGHPFWRHPRIRVTPHVASYSRPESGAEVVAENIRRLRAGRPLLHVVDRRRGY